MRTIALQQLPNQKLTVSLDNTLYDIALIETNGVMSANITRGGVVIVQGARCVAGQPLINYANLEDGNGNLIFLTGNNNTDLPYWDQFTISQTLVYASAQELDLVRGVNAGA